MSVTIEIDEDLAADLAYWQRANESFDEVAARMLRGQLELINGKCSRGFAMAMLLDEVGSTARGELPLPDREMVRSWLDLVVQVAGLRAMPD